MLVAAEPENYPSEDEAALKCRTTYFAKWAQLQKIKGSSCTATRFVANGNGTVTDNLTGLQWEQKDNLDGMVNLADPHDADNLYVWSATNRAASGYAADGPAFTDFLASLNSECFAGQCDWRLPTIAELQTILNPSTITNEPFLQGHCISPNSDGACIDAIFGPTVPSAYWCSTSIAGFEGGAWDVGFDSGRVTDGLGKSDAVPTRAVRGGLGL